MSEPAPIPVSLPAGLDGIIVRCLHRHPGDRYADIAEFVAALAPFARTPRQAATSRERTARLLSPLDVTASLAVCGC